MADPTPTKRVFVTVADTKWELVPTDKLTFPETKEIKRVTSSPGVPGMSLGDLDAGIKSMDGDAWFAWLYVSIRRKSPTLTVAELEATIGDTPVAAVVETVEAEAPEVADPDPPAQASTSDADAQLNGNGSGEKTPPASIPATAGPPT